MMQVVPAKSLIPRIGSVHLWRVLTLLFAGLLTLGLVQIPASATTTGGLLVKDKTVVETDTTSVAYVKIVLTQRLPHRASVAVTTLDGTAKAGIDYQAVSGRVVFPAGAKVARVPVQIIGDQVYEPTELFKVKIYNPVGARIYDRVGVVTIENDDTLPSMSVHSTFVKEGNLAFFKVTLSQPAPFDVKAFWATHDGTATSPSDYYGRHGVVFVPEGHKFGVIAVKTVDDTLYEGHEFFTVHLFKAYNATIDDGHAFAKIIDNDPAPTLSIDDVTVNEGGDAVFTVTQSAISGRDTVFLWKTADGTAVSPGDYVGAHGFVKIPAGHLVEKITVKTVDDTRDEADQTFYVDLFRAHGATILDGRGAATITDNDGPPNLAINDTTIQAEGYHAVLKVNLSAPSGKTVTVDWATADGSAKAASDYTADHGTLTFAPGETTKEITVATVVDHDSPEVAEDFFVNLSNPTNATINQFHPKGTVTIPAN